jgi:hypothetical protein
MTILAFAREAGITINLWEAQNLFARGPYASAPGDPAVRELGEALRFRLDHAPTPVDRIVE